jgi:hypothetical protein
VVASQAINMPKATRSAHGAAPVGDELADLKIQSPQVHKAYQRLLHLTRNLHREQALKEERAETIKTIGTDTTTDLHV